MTPVSMMTRPLPVTAIQWDGKSVDGLIAFLWSTPVNVIVRGDIYKLETPDELYDLDPGVWIVLNHGNVSVMTEERLQKFFTVPDEEHPDVAAFAEVMKARLDDELKVGWETCDPDDLRSGLTHNAGHAVTGCLTSMVDVAIYAMMLHQRGDGT